MEPNTLTPEQSDFINKSTIGALLGPWYALATGLYKEFFLFIIPFYNIYLFIKLVREGRKLAWEKSTKDYEHFYKQQNMLSLVAKIFIGFFLFVILISLSGFMTSKGSMFGKEVAANFAQSLFVENKIATTTAPAFNLDTDFTNYKSDTRGDYKDVSFPNAKRQNNISILHGSLNFTNTQIPVCVMLINNGNEWLIQEFSPQCSAEISTED